MCFQIWGRSHGRCWGNTRLKTSFRTVQQQTLLRMRLERFTGRGHWKGVSFLRERDGTSSSQRSSVVKRTENFPPSQLGGNGSFTAVGMITSEEKGISAPLANC